MVSDQPRVVGRRYAHIDLIRAVAVALVVVAHSGLGHVVPGGSGVTFFFVVSGFIITHLLIRERERTSGFDLWGFYARRAFKILPPLCVIVIVPTFAWASVNPVSWEKFAAQIFFVYNWLKIEGGGGVLPGSEVVWSLAIEEQFYIVFAVFWLFAVRLSQWRALTITLAVTAIIASNVLRVFFAQTEEATQRIYYGTDTRLDAIAFGVLAAFVLRELSKDDARQRLKKFLGSDGVLLAAGLLFVFTLAWRDPFFRDTFRYTLQAIAGSIFVLAPFCGGNGRIVRLIDRLARSRPITVVGLASYSIYLAHLSVAIAFSSMDYFLPVGLSVAVTAFLGLASGILIYFVVEAPFRRCSMRFSEKRQKSLSARGRFNSVPN